jgi:peptidoglycan/xylan/chitin deacetylase (PgdA/CDA1 family)
MNPAFISITFDDGLRCQFDRALPILDRYGLRATFFLIANQDPTHEPWYEGHNWPKIDWREDDIAMVRGLVQAGHEIGSHSLTHDPRRMSGQPVAEASESKRRLEAWLRTSVSSFCYPHYNSHAYLARAVRRAGYEQARGGAESSYYTIPTDAKLDRFNVDSHPVSNAENVSEWIRPGCWHVLTFHGIGDPGEGWKPVATAEFDRQMQELAALRDSGIADVVTFKDGASRVRSGWRSWARWTNPWQKPARGAAA